MTKLKKTFHKNKSFFEYYKDYTHYLSQVLKRLDKKEITDFEKKLYSLRNSDSNIFVFGNGGGAATAMTMANDLGFDVLKKTNKKTFKIISLNDNSSVVTAIANDTGYDNIFLNQLKIHFKKNDKILIFSASGNSKNLVDAAKWVKKKRGKVISILGFDGGKLKKISNLAVHIKSIKGDYGPVEDIQLIINHILAHWFQKNL